MTKHSRRRPLVYAEQTARAAVNVVLRRLKSPPSVVMSVLVLAVSVLALRDLVLHTPDHEFMTTFTTVDVGMLVVLAVERFSISVRHDESQRLVTVAARTVPLAVALLLALYGATAGDHISARVTKVLAALIFIGTAMGILGVVFAALDRAGAERGEGQSARSEP